jgi:hypothetical protein
MKIGSRRAWECGSNAGGNSLENLKFRGCIHRWPRNLTFAVGVLVIASVSARGDSLLETVGKFFSSFAVPTPAATPARTFAPVHGTPLPSGPDAVTEKDFRKIYVEWLNRAIMAHYPGEKDSEGAAYMRASVEHLVEHHDAEASAELKAEGRGFDLQAVADPGLLLMIGLIEPSSARQLTAFERALSLFPGTTYPKYVWFMAAAGAGRAAHNSKEDADQLKTRDEVSLKYLDDGLRDDSFRPDEMAALRWRFDTNGSRDLLSRNGQRVADIFESSPNVDAWVKEYVQGVYFVDTAWQWRGSETTGRVTPQGWQGFKENLAFARAHLERAWDKNSHDPAAAAAMITVCMGESEVTETMRSWFDRSVAADFDFPRAYSNLLWGLYPRWLGNYAEMNEFGRECAATGRFDTIVPYERIAAALDISGDAGDHGAQFSNPQASGEVLAVLNKYFEEPDPPIPVRYAQTVAAIVAHKAGRMDEASRHLAAIQYKPVSSDFLTGLDDLPGLVKQVQPESTP